MVNTKTDVYKVETREALLELFKLKANLPPPKINISFHSGVGIDHVVEKKYYCLMKLEKPKNQMGVLRRKGDKSVKF